MKAKEAAEKVTPETTSEEVKAMIPEYNGPLPRKAWIITFLKSIPENLRLQFSDLK
jgi:hypothetical protein